MNHAHTAIPAIMSAAIGSGLRVTSFKPIMKAESPTAMEHDAQSVDGQLLTRHNIDDRASRNEKEDECATVGMANSTRNPQ